MCVWTASNEWLLYLATMEIFKYFESSDLNGKQISVTPECLNHGVRCNCCDDRQPPKHIA